jgi:hypothetical protein
MAAVAMVTKVQNGHQIQKILRFGPSKSTWKPNFAQIGGFLYFGGHFGFKMAAIANQRCISIRNIIIYLETWQLLGVEKIQNGGHCHGNQGTKWPPNTKILRFGRNLVSK